jgi:hypothetical protein
VKLRIGNKSFGEVADERVKKPSPVIRREMVNQFVIDRVVHLIREYQDRKGVDDTVARVLFLRALGLPENTEELLNELQSRRLASVDKPSTRKRNHTGNKGGAARKNGK